MPKRLLRDWTLSEKIESVSIHAERFFTRLIMKVDDMGCYRADPRVLKSHLYPLKTDTQVPQQEIVTCVEECVAAGLIKLYDTERERYLQIIDFGQQLDKMRPQHPLPDGSVATEITTGYCYVAGTEGSLRVKIGFSTNPWARIKEIQGQNGASVVLRSRYKSSAAQEKELRDLLRDFTTDGEWFTLKKSVINTFSDCYKMRHTATDLLVEIRSNPVISRSQRSIHELEVELEPEIEERQNTAPSGVPGTTVATLPPPPVVDKREIFKRAEKTKKVLYQFIEEYKPDFIDPYVELWNIFAAERKKPQITKISAARARKFATRIKEKSFNFLGLLIRAGKAGDFLSDSSWFTWDWIMESETNYLKVLEGNYDKKEKAPPAPVVKGPKKLEKIQEEINCCYSLHCEGLLTVISLYPEYFDYLTLKCGMNLPADSAIMAERASDQHLKANALEGTEANRMKYWKLFRIIELFKIRQADCGPGEIFTV